MIAVGLGTTTDCAIDKIVRALDRQIHHTKGMEPEYYLTVTRARYEALEQ